jgi:vacuolar-type H+-ATPase subunit H
MREMDGHTTSPLEIIRDTEGEVPRRMAVAQETAVSAIAATEQQAREIVRHAEARGQREGEAQRRSALNEAEREAESILALAQIQSKALRNVRQVEVETAVSQAMTMIIGTDWPAQEKAA